MESSAERDNRMVWKQGKAGHYEVWYATFNHRPSQTGFWIRYTLDAPKAGHGVPTCQLWFAFFDAKNPKNNVALNQRFPIDALEHQATPFALRLGGATFDPTHLRGAICGGGCVEDDPHGDERPLPAVSWDLELAPSTFTHHHLPASAYRRDFADTRVLSPNLLTQINGRIEVGDRVFELEDEPGCQTHVWGRKHAHAWAWGHCNAFREEPTAGIEILSVRLRRGPLVTLPMTMLSLYLGSEVYHFREFWQLPLTRGRWETGLLRFGATGTRVKIVGEFRCQPDDLVRATYADPDGAEAFCHNTEIANASLRVYQRRTPLGKFKDYAKLTAHASAHFEYAGRSPDGRVQNEHLAVVPEHEDRDPHSL
ncbi:MAG: hypothetical protein KAI47_26380 [Deltaproteobacteria bacterium]|nr:hypothetical protein [Deltaproteobacteria bacterium]